MKASQVIAWLFCLLLPAAALAEEVTCESVGGRQNECRLDTRGEVRLLRQLSKSPCREGDTWGVSRDAVWVSGGCRGVFAADGRRGGRDDYRNDYRDGGHDRDDHGRDDGRGRGRDDGRDRGRDDGRDWQRGDDHGRDGGRHDDGPGLVPADDVYQSTGGKPPQSAVFGCLRGRQGQVLATNPRQPGWWEIILRLDDGRYACSVDNNGTVSEFRRLR